MTAGQGLLTGGQSGGDGVTGGTIRWGANDWGTGLPESERQSEGARCAAAECLKIVVGTRVGCVSCRLWRGGARRGVGAVLA